MCCSSPVRSWAPQDSGPPRGLWPPSTGTEPNPHSSGLLFLVKELGSSGFQSRLPLSKRRCDHSSSPVVFSSLNCIFTPGLASRGTKWRRGQNKPAALSSPFLPKTLTGGLGQPEKSYQLSEARGKRNACKPVTGAQRLAQGGCRGVGTSFADFSASRAERRESGGWVVIFASGSLAGCAELASFPSLSTPSPGRSRASLYPPLALSHKSTDVQWGNWGSPQNGAGAVPRESGVTRLGWGSDPSFCTEAQVRLSVTLLLGL